MPLFDANLSFLFTELEFLDRFEAAAQAGFTGVEFLFPYAYRPEQIAERSRRAGLTQVLFNLPPGDWDAGERGIAALPGREDEFRQSLGTAIEYAEALGCKRLHVLAGIGPQGAERGALEETYIANLRYAARSLAKHGIRALIEPLNGRDVPGYLLTGSRQAERIIEAVGSDNLFLQFDIYHMQMLEGDLADTIVDRLDLIDHFQIAGVPGRHEPDVGEINYPFLFDLIDGRGYDGWVGCEYRPRGKTLAGLGWARPYGIGVT